MRIRTYLGLGAYAVVNAACEKPKNVIYYDQYHTQDLPSKELTHSITHVVMTFANSSLFSASPGGNYQPFQPLKEVRALFDHDIKLCLSVGGWGDNAGFDKGMRTDRSRQNFARNLASELDRLGYDCVDIDMEYPGGNGQDYKQIPNSKKKYEIKAFPKLLKEIKTFVGDKELSISVPGLKRDMIAYTPQESVIMNKYVDSVHVMSYDLMNRRDHYTTHQVSVQGTARAIDMYLALGFPAEKLVLGIPFYAKWFTTKKGYKCDHPIGCPTELLENPDGSDTGKSGAMTFEASTLAPPPTNLTTSTDATCGAGTFLKCPTGNCCSPAGFCGTTAAHCGTGCQSTYGKCDGADLTSSFRDALKHGHTDKANGGQWWWDAANRIFWTWDTPELITEAINLMAKTRGVKSVMAWSLGEDSYDWSHLKAMQDGFNRVNGI
ncbi:chitinase [Fusarium mundagurra]|uniref:chitinase n=1 Tax=Fusarium mundagurra TaxID=1567541 RepID=A0A8H5XP25_9HYPO|nr:chitinase [Fusarium mundagurra]